MIPLPKTVTLLHVALDELAFAQQMRDAMILSNSLGDRCADYATGITQNGDRAIGSTGVYAKVEAACEQILGIALGGNDRAYEIAKEIVGESINCGESLTYVLDHSTEYSVVYLDSDSSGGWERYSSI